MKSVKKWLLLTGLVAVSQGVALCDGTVDRDEQDRELIQVLVKKGILQEEEAAELNSAFVASKPSTPAQRIELDGKVEFRFLNTKNDWTDQNNPPVYTKFSVRNASFGVCAQLAEDITARVRANIGGDNGDEPGTGMRLSTGTISWRHSDYLTLSAGYDGVPFNYEENSPVKGMERSVSNQFFDSGLHFGGSYTGVRAEGDIIHGVYYKAAVTNSLNNELKGARGPDGSEDNLASANKMGLWGMLGVKSTLEELNYNVGAYAASKPNNTHSNESSIYAGDSMFGWGAFADLNYDRVGFLAEVTTVKIPHGKTDKSASHPIGFTLMPSYRLREDIELMAYYSYVDAKKTDSTHVYNLYKNDGVSRSVPKSSSPLIDLSDLGKGAKGYSNVNKVGAWYGGVNWYVQPGVKVSVGYLFAQGKQPKLSDSSGGDQKFHQLGAQLQLTF